VSPPPSQPSPFSPTAPTSPSRGSSPLAELDAIGTSSTKARSPASHRGVHGCRTADFCQACGTAVGSMRHRLYHCPLLHPWRVQALEVGRTAPDDHTLYCRGLLPASWLPAWARCTDDPGLTWTTRGSDGTGSLAGHVFTDGSLVCPDQPRYCARLGGRADPPL
jgi:hypothetical protein